MEIFTLIGLRSPRSFWDLSDVELAASCRMIADNGETIGVRGIRAEAMRLSTVWLETLQSPDRSAEDRARRAALLSGLRKRTIQILVKLAWGC